MFATMTEFYYDHKLWVFQLKKNGNMHCIEMFPRGVLLSKKKLRPYNMEVFKLLGFEHIREIYAKIDELREEEAKQERRKEIEEWEAEQKRCKEIEERAIRNLDLPGASSKQGDGYVGVGDGFLC